MRRMLILAGTVAAAALLAACSQVAAQESPASSRTFEVGAFERVSLAGPQDVVVAVGGPPSVRAEGPENQLERLEIVVEGSELKIRNRGGMNSLWGGSRRGVTVHVTVPQLAGVAVAGSGEIRVDRVQGPMFEATLAGSGDIKIADLQVEDARFAIAGSGDIEARGAARRARIGVSGSGDASLGELAVGAAEIRLAGSGDIAVRATESARVDLAGSGDVRVTGPAQCQVNKRGSGSVRCGE
jgi:hypothetical protein